MAEFHTIIVDFCSFCVPTYYVDFAAIGAGAYGSVCSATDTRTGKRVAVKKITNFLQTKEHAKRTFREIRLLKFFRCAPYVHENIIQLRDLFISQVTPEFADVYIVTELMDSDLHNAISSQALGEEHIQLLTYQILRALVFVHSAKIVHRDLKPSNISVNSDCEVKLLDFGLARSLAEAGNMTGYVCSRWYRAPEVLVEWGNYTDKMDVWAVGSIMAEMYRGSPLFRSDDTISHMRAICEVVGAPQETFLKRCQGDGVVKFLKTLAGFAPQDFNALFPTASPEARDLLRRMLALDPRERVSAKEALSHPFFRNYHDPSDEPEMPPNMPFDAGQDDDAEPQVWGERIQAEIRAFHQPPLL